MRRTWRRGRQTLSGGYLRSLQRMHGSIAGAPKKPRVIPASGTPLRDSPRSRNSAICASLGASEERRLSRTMRLKGSSEGSAGEAHPGSGRAAFRRKGSLTPSSSAGEAHPGSGRGLAAAAPRPVADGLRCSVQPTPTKPLRQSQKLCQGRARPDTSERLWHRVGREASADARPAARREDLSHAKGVGRPPRPQKGLRRGLRLLAHQQPQQYRCAGDPQQRFQDPTRPAPRPSTGRCAQRRVTSPGVLTDRGRSMPRERLRRGDF